ncbi:choline transporter-like protein 2 isoform X2 [Antedon mediterranea]|uniref:choline transporter-like protein 2 isoform X2 n=1 Tax=Antedon mediterranea TaxID=105859 RepID=UPI003AF97C22
MGKKNGSENDDEGSEVEFVADKNYGDPEKYDPSFHGPIDNRSCTDVICCLLFLAFIVGMFVVGGYAWMNGDPRKLVYPTDYKGQICGITAGVEKKPYLFFFDLLKCSSTLSSFQLTCPTKQICLEKCPTETYTALTEVFLNVLNVAPDFSKIKPYCDYGFDPETEYNDPTSKYHRDADGLQKMLEDEKCPTYYVESEPFLDRCVPQFLIDVVEGVLDAATSKDQFTSNITDSLNGKNLTLSNGQTFQPEDLASYLSDAVTIFLNFQKTAAMILDDFYAVWYSILLGLCAAMLVSFVYIVLMRFIAGPMVLFGIIGLHAVTAWGCYYCWTRYKELEDMQTDAEQSLADIGFTTDLNSYLNLKDTWYAFGITLAVIFGLLLLITLCLCKQIRIAIGMIQEASKAVASIISTLFFPAVPFILQVILFFVWGSIALFLASSGVQDCLKVAPSDSTFTYVDWNVSRVNFECDCSVNYTKADDTALSQMNVSGFEDLDITCEFQSYEVPDLALYFQAYNLFGLFWLMYFIIALCQVTLAGAFASWYWTFHKKDTPTLAVTASFWRAIRYHLGSIAFGSLIIAIIKMIRVFLEYLERKLKGQENDVVKYLIKCLKCCFWCLEKFMKFLNKNAYIMIAVYGKNFCTSAKKAFFLLMRNFLRVFVVNQLTDFLLFLGVLFVVFLCSVCSFYYFTNSITVVAEYVPAPELNYYWLPIITIGVGSYVIAKGFFSVYDMAVDTLFLCFLEDLERHDGSAEKPYYMSKNLMKIVGKKNKKIKKTKQ